MSFVFEATGLKMSAEMKKGVGVEERKEKKQTNEHATESKTDRLVKGESKRNGRGEK